MSPLHASDLSVRRHERYACSFPATVVVAPAHADAVRPSRAVAGADGRIQTTVVDCSQGGLGLRTTVFFPVGCRLRVTFATAEGAIDAPVRVQRALMTDRTPTYYIGTALDDAAAATAHRVDSIAAALKASGAPLVREKPGA